MPAETGRRGAGPTGRRHEIVVCTGEECRRCGAMALLHELEEWRAGPDGGLRIAASDCLGHCALAPAVLEDGELLGSVTGRRLRTEMRRLGLRPD